MEFILENENLRVTVESHGAELVSVVNRQTGEELLWQADPEVWPRHAPVLFPYCGTWWIAGTSLYGDAKEA